jgi:hypothetical protein
LGGFCQIFTLSTTRKLEINLLVVAFGRLLFLSTVLQQFSCNVLFVGRELVKCCLFDMVRGRLREGLSGSDWLLITVVVDGIEVEKIERCIQKASF